MPYLPQSRRDSVAKDLKALGLDFTPSNAGDLNFVVTRMIDNFLGERGLTYAHLNEMMGALECCKLELYRKIGGPYEDVKVAENGDAYTIDPTGGKSY